MKTKLLMTVLLTAAAGVQAAQPRTVTLKVAHMDCAACPITVRMALEKVLGVSRARVDFKNNLAVVDFDADRTSPALLSQASAHAGFPATEVPEK